MREHVKRHVDLIKILATGGVLSYGDVWNIPQFNLDEVQAVVDESTKFERKVAAHCHGDKGIAIAVEGGVHSVEHCTGVSETTLRRWNSAARIWCRRFGRWIRFLQPGNPESHRRASVHKAQLAAKLRNEGMQRAIASGVKITYGTDAGRLSASREQQRFRAAAHGDASDRRDAAATATPPICSARPTAGRSHRENSPTSLHLPAIHR